MWTMSSMSNLPVWETLNTDFNSQQNTKMWFHIYLLMDKRCRKRSGGLHGQFPCYCEIIFHHNVNGFQEQKCKQLVSPCISFAKIVKAIVFYSKFLIQNSCRWPGVFNSTFLLLNFCYLTTYESKRMCFMISSSFQISVNSHCKNNKSLSARFVLACQVSKSHTIMGFSLPMCWYSVLYILGAVQTDLVPGWGRVKGESTAQ